MRPKLSNSFKIPFKVDCLFYDFDGVMTDNRVIVTSDGKEGVICHRGDGWAVRRFKEQGYRQYIVSTESNQVVLIRAKKLGLPCLLACEDKGRELLRFATKNKINLKKSVYVGNDENDLPVVPLIGYVVAPSDADISFRSKAHGITKAKGGFGVIRELWSRLC